MIVRCVKSAFVSAAFLAAIATSCGTAYANSSSPGAEMVRAAYSTLKQGNARAAVGQFTQAIESGDLEPELKVNALLNRALAHQQTGNHEAAIADYSQAMALDVMGQPLRATALYNRGVSNYKLKMLQQAIEDFTSALLLDPKSSFAFYSRGNALRDSGQYLFALSDYERALRNGHPDKPRVLLASANTYILLGRPSDAKKALNAALEANPNFGEARAQLILLGDQNAKAESVGADPILTGSVAAIAGGTLATKPMLPAPVEPPVSIVAAPAAKLFVDRVPLEEPKVRLASAAPAVPAEEEIIEVEHVPETPEPVAEEVAEPEAPETASVEEGQPEEPQVEEAADAAPSVPSSAWSVQVASATSEDAAWSTWKKMQTRYGVLKSKKPVVVRADLGAKGIYYRVRLGGFDDQKSAAKECSKLKASGVSCYISKTEG
jgi:tetratricopeptide (TPR) repeat protein